MINKLFVSYYQIVVTKLLLETGGVICILCLFTHLAIQFIKLKRYLALIISMSIVIIVGGTLYLSLKQGFVKNRMVLYLKDYNYVKEDSYCETIEKFKTVSKDEQFTGKSKQVYISMQTDHDRYYLENNIVTDNTYDEFQKKFHDVHRVKIKYLPNSKLVLEVEPVK